MSSLVIEASLKLQTQLPPLYLLVFCSFATQFFYNGAYLLQNKNDNPLNARAKWYRLNKAYLNIYQVIVFLLLSIIGSYSLFQIQRLPDLSEGILLVSLLVLSIAYYGITVNNQRFSLRGLGWTKPFVIALSWTGMVVWFPTIFFRLNHANEAFDPVALLLVSSNNFIVITVLAIVFDVKDYADDKNEDIKTFVVRFGLNTTITTLLLPLTLLGLAVTLAISRFFDYPLLAVVCQLLPYLLMGLLIYSLKKKRSIYFYLLLVDGVIIMKGISGIAAVFLA